MGLAAETCSHEVLCGLLSVRLKTVQAEKPRIFTSTHNSFQSLAWWVFGFTKTSCKKNVLHVNRNLFVMHVRLTDYEWMCIEFVHAHKHTNIQALPCTHARTNRSVRRVRRLKSVQTNIRTERNLFLSGRHMYIQCTSTTNLFLNRTKCEESLAYVWVGGCCFASW